MKKTTFTLLLSLSCCHWLAAQCPTDITFSTQGQIDSFQINYPGCADIPGDVTIQGSGITNLNGLIGIASVGGDLTIRGPYLSSDIGLLPNLIGLDSLASIGGSLIISGIDSLVSLHGLGNLSYAGADLEIYGNTALSDISSLKNITSIPGNLSIGTSFYSPLLQMTFYYGNDALTSLVGLENITAVGSLGIFGNDSLVNLAGLDSVDYTTIGNLGISNNPNLSICNIPPICAYLESGGPAYISDNAPGCNSIPEVEAACVVSIEETSGGEPVVVFSPNPAGDFLQVQVSDHEKWEISLFDLRGRLLYRQTVFGSQIIELKDWTSGIYALLAVSGERVFAGKIVKQ